MKLTVCIACVLAALHCLERGMGTIPQSVFSESTKWIWHVGTGFWLITAVRVWFTLEETP